jgi:hypothetical protein
MTERAHEDVFRGAMLRMERAFKRGTGCRLTAEMVQAISLGPWDDNYDAHITETGREVFKVLERSNDTRKAEHD